jgi:hypothetical protein
MATSKNGAVTDAVFSTIKQGQDMAFSGLNAWVDAAAKAFPVPALDQSSFPFVANQKELIEASFGIAEELLAAQKELATKLVDAVAVKSA